MYSLPSQFKDDTYQYKVTGQNKCGSTDFCTPVVPVPTFTQRCPTLVKMEPIYDSCIGHEDRIVSETFLECRDMDGIFKKVDSCVFDHTDETLECAIDEGKFMNAFSHTSGHSVTCRSAVSYADPLKNGEVSRENSFFIPNPLKEHLAKPTMNFDTNAINVSWEDDDADLWCSNSAENDGAMKLMRTLGLKTYAMNAVCGDTHVCKLMKRNMCWLEDS